MYLQPVASICHKPYGTFFYSVVVVVVIVVVVVAAYVVVVVVFNRSSKRRGRNCRTGSSTNGSSRSTLQPLYNTVRYNTVLDITRFKDGSQKCIDYIEK